MSPTLAELIDTTIRRQPDAVLGVLDVLAVARSSWPFCPRSLGPRRSTPPKPPG
ncbi:MAG TPA: hypothetical protein VIW24_15380 [Aldersonia sp.]